MNLFLCWLWLTGAGLPAADPPPAPGRTLSFEELFGNPVIARGQSFEIKQSQLDQAFTAYRSNLAGRGTRLPETKRTVTEAQLLERMIVTQLLTNRASRMDQTVAAGLAEKFYADTKKSAGSDEDFVRQLKATGMTEEQFNQRVFEQALAESVIERELKSTVTVTDAEVSDFYNTGTDELVRLLEEQVVAFEKKGKASSEEIAQAKSRIETVKSSNLARLEEPEKVRVSHILISTHVPNGDEPLSADQIQAKRMEAEKLLARARAGEDFATLVKEHSEDRNLAKTGGEYTFSRSEPYATEFKAAAFSLQPEQISDIVTTVFGFHIIKLLEKYPARKLPLAKVGPEIKAFLVQQKVQRKMPAYFQKLKDEAKVEILEAKYRLDPSKVPEALEPDTQVSK
jgi:peptidyl-prolyl cis-trans isomerase C